jgi:hypothetical protein
MAVKRSHILFHVFTNRGPTQRAQITQKVYGIPSRFSLTPNSRYYMLFREDGEAKEKPDGQNQSSAWKAPH